MTSAPPIEPESPPAAAPGGGRISARPFVSVALPTFNGARYLSDALDSVAAAIAALDDPAAVEVLAVDDGSTDATPRILRAAAERLPVRILDGPRQRNWAASTNAAFREARGELLCILHQDDRWHPSRLARLQRLVEQHPEVAVWAHAVRFIGPAGEVLGMWRCPWPAGRPLEPAAWFPRLLVQNVLAVPGVLFRRQLLDEFGGLDERLPYTADWEFWLRLAQRHAAWVLPDPLADFRIHPESQTLALSRQHEEFVAQLETVVGRHQGELARLGASGRWGRMADLGVEVNAWLAARAARQPWPSGRLLRAVRRAGPVDVLRYIRAAQLVPRVTARLRVRGLTRQAEGKGDVS